jgi:hypothetical protein
LSKLLVSGILTDLAIYLTLIIMIIGMILDAKYDTRTVRSKRLIR